MTRTAYLVLLPQARVFTLTSAPEDTYLSVHVRDEDHFRRSLLQVLGYSVEEGVLWSVDFESSVNTINIKSEDGSDTTTFVDQSVRRIFPQAMLRLQHPIVMDNVFKHEFLILVGGDDGTGEGIMPYASILKSLWYHINNPNSNIRLRKVFFYWICDDIASLEWFRSILLAIEYQDVDDLFEIHTVCHSSYKHLNI